MNHLHLIGSMDPLTGGPCQGIRNTIPILKQLGVNSEVACMDEPASSFLSEDDFPVHALGPGKTAWKYSPKLIPWLLENLPRFDVVIVNGLWQYHTYAINVALSRIKAKSPKVYVMPHGMLDPYFQKAPERKLKALRNWLFWKLIERKTVNNAQGLLFTCQTELLLARQSFKPYLPQKEHNVGYGIEAPPAFKYSMKKAFLELCPQAEGVPYLLFLSRVHHKKGVGLLIQAYAQILNELGEEDIPLLVIAGPGLDTLYGKRMLDLAAADERLSRKVVFTGMLTGDSKWGAFHGCEAFTLPSHQENFGIAVVEALACKKPVLISSQVNIWREIKEQGAGIVADDTVEGTYQLLMEWVSASAKVKALMGENAYDCFTENFAIKPAALRMAKALNY